VTRDSYPESFFKKNKKKKKKKRKKKKEKKSKKKTKKLLSSGPVPSGGERKAFRCQGILLPFI